MTAVLNRTQRGAYRMVSVGDSARDVHNRANNEIRGAIANMRGALMTLAPPLRDPPNRCLSRFRSEPAPQLRSLLSNRYP